ncbi:hypothetical protein PAXINDRAFT_173393 [Paxillus involutus ATCC 200175]|uniref:Uncharacterized protein n=1 Tax=Paxillus involutus ATCC 200175 TaxID=664439 RepID=A0A0C9SNC2_PAXIN|nr:hypothetical protein PAXINDRAFT_173393 [Paxillus involutus ATCC 200175]
MESEEHHRSRLSLLSCFLRRPHPNSISFLPSYSRLGSTTSSAPSAVRTECGLCIPDPADAHFFTTRGAHHYSIQVMPEDPSEETYLGFKLPVNVYTRGYASLVLSNSHICRGPANSYSTQRFYSFVLQLRP